MSQKSETHTWCHNAAADRPADSAHMHYPCCTLYSPSVTRYLRREYARCVVTDVIRGTQRLFRVYVKQHSRYTAQDLEETHSKWVCKDSGYRRMWNIYTDRDGSRLVIESRSGHRDCTDNSATTVLQDHALSQMHVAKRS